MCRVSAEVCRVRAEVCRVHAADGSHSYSAKRGANLFTISTEAQIRHDFRILFVADLG